MRRAGESSSRRGAVGSENLTKPDIQARIAELQAERSRRTDIKADDVLRRLMREADADDLNEPNAARIRAVEDLNESELAVLLGEGAPSPDGRSLS